MHEDHDPIDDHPLLSDAERAAVVAEKAQQCLARLGRLRQLHASAVKRFGTAPPLPADIDDIEQQMRALVAAAGRAPGAEG